MLTRHRTQQGRGRAGGGGQPKRRCSLECSWCVHAVIKSSAFILADNDFDVWIANTRGTRWSRCHASS
ncbi:unnamed protein product [Musa textilis]